MRLAAPMLLVSLAVLVVKPSPVAAAPPAEQRCSDLGAACLCSEPMNWQQAGGALYGGSVDPTDSEGTGSKQCGNDGRTADFDDDAPVWNSVAVPNRPMHAAASWQYVQRITHDGVNEYNWWLGTPASTMNGTICTRSYHNIGTLPWVSSTDHRIKIAQWLGNTTNLTQLEWAWDEYEQPDGYLRAQAPGVHGQVVSFNDCRGAWCRIEYCIDYDGNATVWRVRITKVDDPAKTEVLGAFQPYTVTPPLTFESAADVAIGDLYSQCVPSDPCLLGTRHIAFGIQTLVEPIDPSFWPGPAHEVEGPPLPVPSLGAASLSAVCLLLGTLGWAFQRPG